MELILENLEDTEKFGKALAKTLLIQQEKGKFLNTIYLFGEMGIGKTTLTRAFVSSLPNAENAEIASPSFTICHEYPTKPEVYHADLYRLPNDCDLPEELQDLGKKILLLIEWPERLSLEVRVKNRLDICLKLLNDKNVKKSSLENIDNFDNLCEKKRQVIVLAHGEIAQEFETELHKHLQNCFFSK